ncbi:hypothetical protein [Mycolicibacterium goodii]|uniref:hypothetical protein n=1 Tax=Mycolicibacterium goodii TaxID=134601 RepID=UPI001BDD9385|nr:hypothetical protein [Mycolicibacterium goodii]MBU8833831.1 hypothetical protein [Mycolicibacterium goodii]
MARRGLKWTEIELATLDLIEQAADRAVSLRGIFEAETASPQVRSTRRVVEIGAELRQVEAQLHKLLLSLGLDADEAAPGLKSARQQRAPNTRWSNGKRVPVKMPGQNNVTPLSAYRRSKGPA